MQALKLDLAAACVGPANTGKTETAKELGHALGRWVVVVNCSDQFSACASGALVSGLAMSGAWGMYIFII